MLISEEMISNEFWNSLRLARTSIKVLEGESEKIMEASRVIYERFPSDVAGTVSKDSVSTLWLLSRYFRPKVIAEVGTFIGRSTLALSEGAGDVLESIHTCDSSFSDFFIPEQLERTFVNSHKISYHPKTTSVAMFEGLLPKYKGRVDLFFLDGRIGAADISLMRELSSEHASFVLDDFEGLEKGVVNGLLVRGTINNLTLIRPEVILSAGERPRVQNLALLIPGKLINLTRQQRLPLEMV